MQPSRWPHSENSGKQKRFIPHNTRRCFACAERNKIESSCVFRCVCLSVCLFECPCACWCEKSSRIWSSPVKEIVKKSIQAVPIEFPSVRARACVCVHYEKEHRRPIPSPRTACQKFRALRSFSAFIVLSLHFLLSTTKIIHKYTQGHIHNTYLLQTTHPHPLRKKNALTRLFTC